MSHYRIEFDEIMLRLNEKKKFKIYCKETVRNNSTKRKKDNVWK